jgi:hypothetical protein
MQILLALLFLGAGGSKIITPRSQLLANPQMAWATDFSESQIKMIGAAEVAGAIGLVVPAATRILPFLTPLAASGLAVLMLGAVATHARREEPFLVPLVLAALTGATALMLFRTRRRPPQDRRSSNL